jgi:adenine-specific DNA-methyltransferase
LTNAKVYDKDGEHPFKGFTRDAEINRKRGLPEDTITDNLIIKGNNLLALHTLKEEFAGKVKLIYIDPPYNTGNDGFKYNDSFNHSTWLTFMKNRLEIARQLLRDDGVIFVQIDNSPSDFKESPELGYLLILLDEVFLRKNYIGIQVWKKKGNASNTESNIGTITESILMYAKNFNSISFNLQDYKRIYKFEENGIYYNLEKPLKTNSGEYERKTMLFGIETKEGTFYPPKGKRWTIGEDLAKEYVKNNKYKIY